MASTSSISFFVCVACLPSLTVSASTSSAPSVRVIMIPVASAASTCGGIALIVSAVAGVIVTRTAAVTIAITVVGIVAVAVSGLSSQVLLPAAGLLITTVGLPLMVVAVVAAFRFWVLVTARTAAAATTVVCVRIVPIAVPDNAPLLGLGDVVLLVGISSAAHCK